MTIIENFLSDQRIMRDTDFADLMNWTPETMKAKLARRETPEALRIKRLVLFRFDDVAQWLTEQGNAIQAKGDAMATSDLLGGRK